MPKETSEEVAEMASKVMNSTICNLKEGFTQAIIDGNVEEWFTHIYKNFQTLAASCLSQRSDADD